MIARPILIFLLLSVPLTTLANEWERAYPNNKLLQEKPRFERRLNELYVKGIQPFLTQAESRALKDVQFKFPLVGENSQDPSESITFAGLANSEECT